MERQKRLKRNRKKVRSVQNQFDSKLMQRDSECAPSCVEFIYLNTVHDAFVSRVIEEYQ